MNRLSFRSRAAALAPLALALAATGLGLNANAAPANKTKFEMVRSAKAEAGGCLAKASADVKIRSLGPVEVMDVARPRRWCTATRSPTRRPIRRPGIGHICAGE